jgi:anti-sigma factor RsiW
MEGRERDDLDWERLDRYVRGVGGPDERAALDVWVNADPARRALAEAMRNVGRLRSSAESRPDARRALARVRRRLGIGEANNPLVKANGSS